MPKSKPKRRFVLRENPGTLRKLSSIAVAAELWREEITQCDSHDRPLNLVLTVLESQAKLPITIAKLIDPCIEPVRSSLYNWLKRIYLQVFLPYVKDYDILRKYYHCITWYPDCSIDIERTAEKLIACEDLNTLFRYKVACTYCLEEHVRKLWLNLPPTDRDLDEIFFETNPIVFYWHCQLSHKHDENEVMDVNTFKRAKPDNWPAWRYCWSRLSSKDQVDQAVSIIKSTGESKYSIKYLLALLTTEQLVKVLKRTSDRIMAVLARTPADVQYALQIWQFLKNWITGDIYFKIFVEIIDADLDVDMELWRATNDSIKQHNASTIIKGMDLTNVNVNAFLYDVWQDTPDYLKNNLFEKHGAELLVGLSLKDACNHVKLPRDVRLTLELLSRRNHLANNTFWRKHWTEVIVGTSAANLDRIIKLCFRNEKDIVKFKKANMIVFSKIEKYCGSLLNEGSFDELNEFLDFCTSDRNVKISLKRNLVWKRKSAIIFCTQYADDPVKMRAFDEFISDMCPEPDHRKNFKCKLITFNDNYEFLFGLVANGLAIPAKNAISLLLTREAELKNVKKKLKKYCFDMLSKGDIYSFNISHWNEFLSWCLNDDQQQLDKFRSSLPVDHIYRVVFASCVKTVEKSLVRYEMTKKFEDSNDTDDDDDDDDEWTDDSDSFDEDVTDEDCEDCDEEKNDDENRETIDDQIRDCVITKDYYVDDVIMGFQRLDNFLLWYFGSKDKVSEFKFAKFKRFDVSPLKQIFASKREHLIVTVLHWFSDRDVDRLIEFQSSLKSTCNR